MKDFYKYPRSLEEQIINLQMQIDEIKKYAFDPTHGAGEWDSTKQYDAGDTVYIVPTENTPGGSFFAIQANRGYYPGVSVNIGVYWQPLAQNGAQGPHGARGLTGTGLSHITMGDPYVSGQQTVTPLNFEYTDGTAQELAAYAQNGKTIYEHNLTLNVNSTSFILTAKIHTTTSAKLTTETMPTGVAFNAYLTNGSIIYSTSLPAGSYSLYRITIIRSGNNINVTVSLTSISSNTNAQFTRYSSTLGTAIITDDTVRQL